jgi:hypothetical protein
LWPWVQRRFRTHALKEKQRQERMEKRRKTFVQRWYVEFVLKYIDDIRMGGCMNKVIKGQMGS